MSGPRIVVRVSDLQVVAAPATLAAIALGSCVAIILHDREAGIGGLAHVLLPSGAGTRLQDGAPPGRFAQAAVPELVERMTARGARVPRITARLVGGASMFTSLTPPGSLQVGDRNVVAAREALHRHGIRLVAEAVGGDFGRSVEFDVTSGRVQISTYRQGSEEL